ncbi:MAG: hypothetical protein O7E52_24660 [Candidatus Poribacteria bacterium]|nr:hypothetical protein [Candidatus Poribacteria bacterium]
MNAKEKCLFINSQIPKGGLFTGEKKEVHPDNNTTWRISPEPFWISQEELEQLEELGTHLLQFYKACNLLYSQSVRGIQPDWVAAYLDQGKPESVIDYGRMNRFKSHLPQVIRPDILPTSDGMVITELDSVPGGMGFTGSLATQYVKLDYDIIGGGNGMMFGFAEMVRALAKRECPRLAIVVSDEAGDYWDEMKWFESALRGVGLEVYTIKPNDVIFTEDGLFLESDYGRVQIDVLYRFFELFDLKNIPKVELMLYSAKKRTVVMTPPPKTYLEEKLLFALFHHSTLRPFWRRELGKKTYPFLQNVIPRTWLLDARELPPHAVIPDLEIDGLPVTNWRQIIPVTQRQRELVIKPSGFSELAWGSRGVSIGHDLSTEDWELAVENALTSFYQTPYVLQKFHRTKRVTMTYYDFHTGAIRRMPGRPILRPYYFTTGDKVRLAGIQATICPEDKKLLHGMVDSIIVPCAVNADTVR